MSDPKPRPVADADAKIQLAKEDTSMETNNTELGGDVRKQIDQKGHAEGSLDTAAVAEKVSSGKPDQTVTHASSSGSQMDKQARAIVPRSYSKTHKFWETQPVIQFKDISDTSLPEGPIEPTTPISEVKPEPYNLPGSLEWTTCDLKSDDMLSQVYDFLKANYPDEESSFRVDYSREFLRWALCPPGYHQSWHIGIRVKASKELVAFISGVPARIKVHDVVVNMAKIDFLCVIKEYRSKGFAPILIKEVTRRVNLENIWQLAAYTSLDILPTPFTSCQYWSRLLNPKKLIDIGYSELRPRMTMSRTVKLYKLPDAPGITPGFKAMESLDISGVTKLLREYLSEQFGVATEFNEMEVEHLFLPRENLVYSYVVVSPKTSKVTDFCCFYALPFAMSNDPSHTVKSAYLYYNVSTETSFMKDVLIVSKQKGFDIFIASDLMHNKSFLKELKFDDPGDEAKLHYYLYNYRLSASLKPSEVGVVLW